MATVARIPHLHTRLLPVSAFDSAFQSFSPSVLPHHRIRPLETRDHADVLAINAASQPAVALLARSDLTGQFSLCGTHWVAERFESGSARVVGYLLTFDSDEADYQDEEMVALRQQVTRPFVYVGQIAVAPDQRRRGLGGAFYELIFRAARERGRPIVCCDVNVRPPNDASLRFHQRLGFVPLAEMETSIGFRVVLLTCEFRSPGLLPPR